MAFLADGIPRFPVSRGFYNFGNADEIDSAGLTDMTLPSFDDVELGRRDRSGADRGYEMRRSWLSAGHGATCAFTPNRFTDPKIARENGQAAPIVPGIMALAMMARMLTEWAGAASVRDLDAVFRQPVPHNAPITIAGTITDTRREDGENLVECDVLMTGAQGERYVTAKAVLALPSRADA